MNSSVTTCVSLVGMPGVGKSTLGVVLAKAMAKQFVDTDLLIQQDIGCSLQSVLDEQGYLALRAIEEKVVLNADFSNMVIATGGSVVYSPDVMGKLKALGPVIYLKATLADLEDRLHNFSDRGIASAPGATLASIYAERCPLYERYADIVCDTSELVSQSRSPLEAAVQKIQEALS